MVVETKLRSRGIQRVVDALAARPHPANVKVFHVIGRNDQIRAEIDDWDGAYAIIQYCIRSTMRPSTQDWIDLWADAEVVWSYYDLRALCEEDGTEDDFTFYHAPLGISDVFRTEHREPKIYRVTTHGDYMTQGTRECYFACAPKQMAHVGTRFSKPGVDFYADITDHEMAAIYAMSHYVCGLRRVEGFELPAAEGLAQGARPIMFDRPHYRRWFEDKAVYIEESPRPDTIEQLAEVFRTLRPVQPSERAWARATFDWDRIIEGFYAYF